MFALEILAIENTRVTVFTTYVLFLPFFPPSDIFVSSAVHPVTTHHIPTEH